MPDFSNAPEAAKIWRPGDGSPDVDMMNEMMMQFVKSNIQRKGMRPGPNPEFIRPLINGNDDDDRRGGGEHWDEYEEKWFEKIGGFFEKIFKSWTGELQNEMNREMAEYQFGKNVDMWNMMNEYNHPSQQMERYKEAGLNPRLMYGSGGGASAGLAKNLPQYSRPEMTRRSTLGFNPLDIVGRHFDVQYKKAVTDNVEEIKTSKRLQNQFFKMTFQDRLSQFTADTEKKLNEAKESGQRLNIRRYESRLKMLELLERQLLMDAGREDSQLKNYPWVVAKLEKAKQEARQAKNMAERTYWEAEIKKVEREYQWLILGGQAISRLPIRGVFGAFKGKGQFTKGGLKGANKYTTPKSSHFYYK